MTKLDATVLDATVLGVLLPGFAHHVDIGKTFDAVIAYGADGQADMTIPGAAPMQGRWHLLPQGYHVAWKDGPAGDWTITHQAGRLTYVDPAGRAAGHVTRIEPIAR
jgi:hypothetical protein